MTVTSGTLECNGFPSSAYEKVGRACCDRAINKDALFEMFLMRGITGRLRIVSITTQPVKGYAK
jgi:hypothetical protein